MYRREYNEELHQLYSLLNVIRGIKFTERVMGWACGTRGTQDKYKYVFDREA